MACNSEGLFSQVDEGRQQKRAGRYPNKHGNNTILATLSVIPGLVAGCAAMTGDLQGLKSALAPPGLAGLVANKAIRVADQIGGADGFGGMLMAGYHAHMMNHMGFHGMDDLADPSGSLTVLLGNHSNEDCIFHLSYFAGHLGPDEGMMDVVVPAGADALVDLPCMEILGAGELEAPGAPGCHFAHGEAVDNVWAVPGFLGTDFHCGGQYQFHLMHDEDDLDGDADTEEWICLSDAAREHMQFGGPTGHGHDGGGMMGGHMGR